MSAPKKHSVRNIPARAGVAIALAFIVLSALVGCGRVDVSTTGPEPKVFDTRSAEPIPVANEVSRKDVHFKDKRLQSPECPDYRIHVPVVLEGSLHQQVGPDAYYDAVLRGEATEATYVNPVIEVQSRSNYYIHPYIKEIDVHTLSPNGEDLVTVIRYQVQKGANSSIVQLRGEFYMNSEFSLCVTDIAEGA